VIRTIREVLEGRQQDLRILDSPDRAIRQAVSAELIAASLDPDAEKHERARELFFKHGYFDDAVRNLRDAESIADRASAAQSLGLLGSRLATTPLIAALFDPESEVREAANAALIQIQDPSVVIGTSSDVDEDERQSLLESPTSGSFDELNPLSPSISERESGNDIQHLIVEEGRIRQDIAALENKLDELTAEQSRLDRLVQSSAAREAKFRAEALELRNLETVATTHADAERGNRLEAENQLLELVDAVSHLQLEIESLSRTAEELKLERSRVETARLKDAERARTAAQQVYDGELARLITEEQKLERACEEVARRRADLERAHKETEAQTAELIRAAEQVAARRIEVDAARQKAENEAEELAVAHARMEAAKEAGKRLEAERREIEAELAEYVENEHRLLAEAEARLVEQKRVEEETRQRAAEVDQRVAELSELREEKDLEEKRLLDEEAAIRDELERQADHEKRIREEIANLQQLAEEERRRLEDETQRRLQAETRLQQERERFKAEAAARLKAEAEYERLKEQSQPQIALENGEAPGDAADPEILTPAPLVVQELVTASNNSEAIRSDLLSEDPVKRASALSDLVRLEGKDAYNMIVSGFDDQSAEVRNAAALALLEIDEERPVEWFTRAFEEASAERRQKIGLAIASSGVATEAVNNLSGGTREDTYNALCMLFLMAKTGEVQPLVTAIEDHKDLEVRRAAIRLLTLSGQSEIADAAVKRRLNGFPAAS
jgi:hypothetical protein